MRLLFLFCTLALGACATAPAAPGRAAPIAVAARVVPLDPAAPSRTALGGLRYMGGLHLTSRDRRWGGLSALRWDDGVLVALSDEGSAFALTPREADGRLIGIAAARVTRLDGADGQPLPAVKAQSDAEALELLPDPGCTGACPAAYALVSLETDSTIWRYRLVDHLPVGAAKPVAGGAAWRARQSRTNGGVEAIAAGSGVRVMISEEMREPDGNASAWVIADDGEQGFGVALGGVFVPVDAAMPVPGELLILQRNYRRAVGTWSRLSRVALLHGPEGWRAGPAETIATLGPPLASDNFEGLALRREGGRTFLYTVSDDNFSATQRTLLMKWEVVG